jgi:hypothetical protein
MNPAELLQELKRLGVKLTCCHCKYFRKLNYADTGEDSGLGKCHNTNTPKNKVASTGKYGWNHCDYFEIKEADTSE